MAEASDPGMDSFEYMKAEGFPRGEILWHKLLAAQKQSNDVFDGLRQQETVTTRDLLDALEAVKVEIRLDVQFRAAQLRAEIRHLTSGRSG